MRNEKFAYLCNAIETNNQNQNNMNTKLTTEQAAFLKRRMDEIIADVMITGKDPIEAVKECLRKEFDFCGEMAMQQTNRAKQVKSHVLSQVKNKLY